MGRAAAPPRTARLKGPAPDGNPFEPDPRRQRHAGADRRFGRVHDLARPARRWRREDLRHLLQPVGRRARQGLAVTFSGVPVGQIESINLVPNSPQFVRVRINVNDDTPILEGTTATIRLDLHRRLADPDRSRRGARRPARRAARAARSSAPRRIRKANARIGVPVIPTKPGALGQMLNTAPELLERVSTLTERLTELLSDRNQESIAGILDNLERVSGSLAERGPEIAATIAEARIAIRQAGDAADRIGALAGTTNNLLERGRPAADQRSAHDHPPRRADDGRAGRRDRRCAARHPGLLEPDPARGRPADPRPARDLRIAARDHRPAQPAGRRRRDRRPAPARLSRRRKKESTMRLKLIASRRRSCSASPPASAAARPTGC